MTITEIINKVETIGKAKIRITDGFTVLKRNKKTGEWVNENKIVFEIEDLEELTVFGTEYDEGIVWISTNIID